MAEVRLAESPTSAPAIEVISLNEPLPGGEALAWQAETGVAVGRGERPPVVLVWRAGRSLIVTRNEARLATFAAAARAMDEEGWPVLVRESGGGPFPVAPGTVQITLALPNTQAAGSLDALYGALAAPILDALGLFGVAARIAAVPHAFCSGAFDIAVEGRKIGGMAQRWSGGQGRGFAMASAAVIVDEDPEELTTAVNRFYDLAGADARCRPGAVTRLAAHVAAPSGALLVSAVMERLERCFLTSPWPSLTGGSRSLGFEASGLRD